MSRVIVICKQEISCYSSSNIHYNIPSPLLWRSSARTQLIFSAASRRFERLQSIPYALHRALSLQNWQQVKYVVLLLKFKETWCSNERDDRAQNHANEEVHKNGTRRLIMYPIYKRRNSLRCMCVEERCSSVNETRCQSVASWTSW